VVGETLEIRQKLLAREVLGRRLQIPPVPQVGVRFDDAGHDGLAGQVDSSRTFRRLHRTSAADRRELAVLHDERGVFDRRDLVAGNQPGAFEYRGASCPRWRLAHWRRGTRCDDQHEAWHDDIRHSPHTPSCGPVIRWMCAPGAAPRYSKPRFLSALTLR